MKVGYYLNYIYNLVVTSIIVFINYSSIFNFKFYNSQFFYLFSLIIIIIITIYFIKYKMLYEHFNLSKKLTFAGKFIFISLFFKFFNSILPFETIYCETGASSVEKDLSNLESKDGQKITSNNNSNNKNSTNFNESSNNSNEGNNNNNTNINQQLSNSNNTYNNNDSVHTKTGDNIKSSLTTTTSNNLLPTKINPVIPVTPVTL